MELKFTIEFYKKPNKKCPIAEYLKSQNRKTEDKILAYLYNLATLQAFRQEPYSRQIKGKLRELKVETRQKSHRIFYFMMINKRIMILHAFLKKTEKTPKKETKKALEYMEECLSRHK